MGLDMYLSRKYYVKNWELMTPEQLYSITITRGGKASSIPVEKITNIEIEEIYWRKANAIHKWFVDNVQDGKDDCAVYDVSREQLQILLNVINEVVADHSKAKLILPTRDGFFFGGTDYNEYYWEDIEFTQKELTRILSQPKSEEGGSGAFYYQSSW